MKKSNYILISFLIITLFISSCGKDNNIDIDEPTYETILNDKVQIISTNQNDDDLISIDSSTITLTSSFVQSNNIEIGSVLIGEESEKARFGYALKVKEITVQGSNSVIVTEPASMIDIFQQADINIESTFGSTTDTVHLKNGEKYFEFQVDKIFSSARLKYGFCSYYFKREKIC